MLAGFRTMSLFLCVESSLRIWFLFNMLFLPSLVQIWETTELLIDRNTTLQILHSWWWRRRGAVKEREAEKDFTSIVICRDRDNFLCSKSPSENWKSFSPLLSVSTSSLTSDWNWNSLWDTEEHKSLNLLARSWSSICRESTIFA